MLVVPARLRLLQIGVPIPQARAPNKLGGDLEQPRNLILRLAHPLRLILLHRSELARHAVAEVDRVPTLLHRLPQLLQSVHRLQRRTIQRRLRRRRARRCCCGSARDVPRAQRDSTHNVRGGVFFLNMKTEFLRVEISWIAIVREDLDPELLRRGAQRSPVRGDGNGPAMLQDSEQFRYSCS